MDAIHLGREFEHRIIAIDELAHILETVVAERLPGRR